MQNNNNNNLIVFLLDVYTHIWIKVWNFATLLLPRIKCIYTENIAFNKIFSLKNEIDKLKEKISIYFLKPGMVVHACNSGTCKAVSEALRVQCHAKQYSKFKPCLDMTTWIKNKIELL